jgi:hypothetical protein
MIVLLVREMEVGEGECRFMPSKTYLCKKLDKKKIDDTLESLKKIENEDQLKKMTEI